MPSDDYVDIRAIHPKFTTIPCKECGDDFHVSCQFALNHDTWYCPSCTPEELRDLPTGPDVTVRL